MGRLSRKCIGLGRYSIQLGHVLLRFGVQPLSGVRQRSGMAGDKRLLLHLLWGVYLPDLWQKAGITSP